MNFPLVRRLAALTTLACTATLCMAQSTPVKPAAKPAPKAAPAPTSAAPAAGKTLSMGTAASSSPILTREELRACFGRRDFLTSRLKEADGARTALDSERVALSQEQATLHTERENMAGMKGAIEDLNNKAKAFQQDVDAWNKAVAAFNESKATGSAAEKQRTELNQTGESLRARQAELQAERGAVIAKGEESVKVFNARAAAVDQKIADWNERNRKLNADNDALQKERDTWAFECGDRRYREDDEKAILSGR
jgi:chromosome segregation ATPase